MRLHLFLACRILLAAVTSMEHARAAPEPSQSTGAAASLDLDARVTAAGSTTPRSLSVRAAEVVNAKDFGAIGDGVADDTAAIQAAIDHAIYAARVGRVFLPDGVYRTTNTIHLGYGTDYRHIELLGAGRCYGGNRELFGGTVIRADFSDRMALNIQGGRQTVIRGITIIGRNAVHLREQWNKVPRHWKGDRGAWLDPGLPTTADSRHAPYAGIAIDGYSGSATNVPRYPDVAYPEFLGHQEQFGKLYSGNFLFEELDIRGFVVGVVTHPNGSDGNGDFLTIRDSTISAVDGLSIGHSQSRNVNITNVRFDGCWNAITTRRHGARTGQLGGLIAGSSFDGCYQAFDVESAYAGSFQVTGCYAELLTRVGRIQGGASGERAVIFTACNFNFELEEYGPQEATHLDASGSGSVVFDACTLRTTRGFAFAGDGVEFRHAATLVGGTGYWNAPGLAVNLAVNGSRGVLPSFVSAQQRRRFPMSLKSKVNPNVDAGPSGSYGVTVDLDATGPRQPGPSGLATYGRTNPYPAWSTPQFGDEQLHTGLGIEFSREGLSITRSGLDYTFDGSRVRGPESGRAAKLFGVGDLVVDLVTEARFFVSSIEGTSITLTQLSGYQRDAGGRYTPRPGADITVATRGTVVVHTTRLFSHLSFFVGDFTAGSPVISNIRRVYDDLAGVVVADARHGWLAQEGDMIVSGSELNPFQGKRIVLSHLVGGVAAVIAPGGLATAGQVTLTKPAQRTATEVPINFWVRHP